ncbi:MAG: hypothetical protein IT245_08320, partial [Bacteroidia bacterium]|nr:hypothetical protein [Bacteroidia bacterium]
IGLAFGLKFNVLLLLPLLFLIPLLSQGFNNVKLIVLNGLKSVFFFLLGIIIAIPCLALSPIKPIFLKTYIHETFGGTVKAYDDANLNFVKWFFNGFGDTFLGTEKLAIPFVLFVLIMLLIDIKRSINNKDYSSPLLIVSGGILLAVIMFLTKRLWPHYLWTGYILLILGLLYSISIRMNEMKGKLELTVMSLFIASSLLFFIKRELPIYRNFEKTESVVECKEWSYAAIDYIKENFTGKRIATDGTMLYPFEDFVLVDRYHPFSGTLNDLAETKFYWYKDDPIKIWDDNNDVVVFFQLQPEKLMNNPRYAKNEVFQKQYVKFTEMTSSQFTIDTSFGEIIIYKRK